MTYGVKDVFVTLQGEGVLAGRRAVFVRFAGCNLWRGTEGSREADATRNDVDCPRWCDTDFVRGRLMTAEEIAERVAHHVNGHPEHLVVLTGGEPWLQVDQALCAALRAACPEPFLSIETNGTLNVDIARARAVDWVVVSPKQHPERVAWRHGGHELKVPWPNGQAEPEAYREALPGFVHHVVTPRATTHAVGISSPATPAIQEAVKYVSQHPAWRLSLQMHKHVGLP